MHDRCFTSMLEQKEQCATAYQQYRQYTGILQQKYIYTHYKQNDDIELVVVLRRCSIEELELHGCEMNQVSTMLEFLFTRTPSQCIDQWPENSDG